MFNNYNYNNLYKGLGLLILVFNVIIYNSNKTLYTEKFSIIFSLEFASAIGPILTGVLYVYCIIKSFHYIFPKD
jgi:hypothetical protein